MKFRGKKRISTLAAFLQYHSDEKEMRTDLVECGRKFVFMLGAYYYHCRDMAFYMKDREAVTVSVDSVMLDAAFFRKMNPNYTKPQPNELLRNETERNRYFEYYSESSSEGSPDRIKGNGVEPTNRGERLVYLLSDRIRV